MSSPVAADPKIIDLMKEHKGDDPWVALEFFPPRTAQGVENLKARLPRMKVSAVPQDTLQIARARPMAPRGGTYHPTPTPSLRPPTDPLHQREAKPMYVDITWGAGGTTADATMDITLTAKKEFGLIPNMHLT